MTRLLSAGLLTVLAQPALAHHVPGEPIHGASSLWGSLGVAAFCIAAAGLVAVWQARRA
ncbi:hypothetical protein [uncultured Roseobacter sp.]|uniref:hypothetical protein n=1 Tax=uncultured Roseobacter sp. TaxID=114847 RepID=UPI0026071F3A|nr:hypothetical protein [uncultured Roseobacter sp.]